MGQELLELLTGLDGVRQCLRYHPEQDALYHCLQVFDLARGESHDPALWAAALFHDVGKAQDSVNHELIGADWLRGLVSPRVVFLVEHHMDLMCCARRTGRKLRATRMLSDLKRLRDWDLRGRRVDAAVLTPKQALELLQAATDLLGPIAHEKENSH